MYIIHIVMPNQSPMMCVLTVKKKFIFFQIFLSGSLFYLFIINISFSRGYFPFQSHESLKKGVFCPQCVCKGQQSQCTRVGHR